MNVDRIARRAGEIRPVRILLSILVAPLYLLGFVAAVLWVLVVWFGAAAVEGFAAGKSAVPVGGEE